MFAALRNAIMNALIAVAQALSKAGSALLECLAWLDAFIFGSSTSASPRRDLDKALPSIQQIEEAGSKIEAAHRVYEANEKPEMQVLAYAIKPREERWDCPLNLLSDYHKKWLITLPERHLSTLSTIEPWIISAMLKGNISLPVIDEKSARKSKLAPALQNRIAIAHSKNSMQRMGFKPDFTDDFVKMIEADNRSS